ncbi:MAG: TasA family protein [Candidatus Nanopelagicales bacterium]
MDDLLAELDSYDTTSKADRERRRRLVTTAAIVGLAFVGVGQLATGALFEDSATAAVSYASGNVAIQANGSSSIALAPATNLAPGDTVYRAVNVANTGSLDLRYAISGQTTSDTKNLSSVLSYTIYTGVAPGPCSIGNIGAAPAIASNKTIGLASTALVGNKANGFQAGDRNLATGPANNEDLCVAMTLPLATTSAFASASANVTLTFDAEQTKNN